ncbi:MAG TPA: cytochrome c [Polyangiaceae bacterium]|nr:cytochrome c [Polyangiaceae bacterium]
MKNRAGLAGFVGYWQVFTVVIAAACSSAGGESSGAGSEQQVDGSATAGTLGSQNEAGGAPVAGGGESSKPDPIASGNVGSVGEEPEPDLEPSRGGTSGAGSESSGDAGATDEPSEPAGPGEAFLRGEELVKQSACVTCHQADYSGFTVFPNITPDVETGIGAWTDEQIIEAIRGGRDADGSTLCATMQRYALSDEQAADVVAFLRGIPAVPHRITSACPGHGQ